MPQFADTAIAFAASGVVGETNEAALAQLGSDYSISSVEEVVALAQIDARQDGKLLERVGLNRRLVQRLARQFRSAPSGRDELVDWSRYDRFSYTTGLEIDLDKPPPDQPQAFATGAAGVRVGGSVAGDLAAPSPSFAGFSLIDPYLSPIRDQGNRGTCTAFAGVACLEYNQRRFGGHHSDLSEQFAYWQMVTGTAQHSLVAMFGQLKAAGTCRERTWPYFANELPGNDAQDPPPPHAQERALAYRPRDVRQLPARSVGAIRAAIAGYAPVAIGIPVYASWYESPVVRKYCNITVPLPGEVPERVGHAIALVGYEDNPDYAGGGYFIVRNSWNHHWATEGAFGPGYGTIPYRYVANFNWDAWYVAS
jgi:C1A family cysteine protease